MYIRATGNISPQKTFGHSALAEAPVAYTGNRLACIEPEYKEFIDPKLIRRMSRIIRMGVAAAMECLKEADIKMPDAITTGTAYGCLEDTNLFLGRMVEFNEELLTPTAFIQSTHNTIGAQIGLMLQCNNYNNAYVHRAFSFENALLDAVMLLREKEAAHVLVGAIDEIVNPSFTILNRFGIYKQGDVSNLELYKANTKGTIAGEGASFFALTAEPSGNDYAKLEGLHTFYKPAGLAATEKQISGFLQRHAVSMQDIDLVITGRNGDAAHDEPYAQLTQSLFGQTQQLNFKHLCGEYPTASAFGFWLAARILKTGNIPELLQASAAKPVKRVLLYNSYKGSHHSLSLLAAC